MIKGRAGGPAAFRSPKIKGWKKDRSKGKAKKGGHCLCREQMRQQRLGFKQRKEKKTVKRRFGGRDKRRISFRSIEGRGGAHAELRSNEPPHAIGTKLGKIVRRGYKFMVGERRRKKGEEAQDYPQNDNRKKG